MPHYELMQSVHAWAMFILAKHTPVQFLPLVREAMLAKQWDWVYGIRWDIYSFD